MALMAAPCFAQDAVTFGSAKSTLMALESAGADASAIVTLVFLQADQPDRASFRTGRCQRSAERPAFSLVCGDTRLHLHPAVAKWQQARRNLIHIYGTFAAAPTVAAQ